MALLPNQAEADNLLAGSKQSILRDVFSWHDPAKPLDTLAAFLDLVHARFSAGYMLPLI